MSIPHEPSEPQLLCRCGESLSLAGATPGRVGRCPSCGRRFQVESDPFPDHEPGPVEDQERVKPGSTFSPADPTTAQNDSGDSQIRSDAGYDLGPELEVQRTKPSAHKSFPTSPEPEREARSPASGTHEKPKRDRDAWRSDAPRKKPTAAVETEAVASGAVGRGGILPLPRERESTLLGSLRYPLWDMLGIACPLLIAPIMSVLSLIVLGAMPMVNRGGEMLVIGPITFGFAIIFALGLGFVLQIFEAVIVASAQGEVHHPRWPDLELAAALRTLVRWGLAWGPPLALIWYGLKALNVGGAESLMGQLFLAGIYALSGAFALVSMLAMVMHEDIGAALPQTVLPAMFRLGTGLLGPLGLLVLTVVLSVLGYAMLFRMGLTLGLVPLLLATWLAWVLLLFASLVVMRALGNAYQSRIQQVGWFYREPKRETVATEPPPPIEASSTVPVVPRGPASEPIPVEDDGMGDW